MKTKTTSEQRKYIRNLSEKNSLILIYSKKKDQKNNVHIGLLRDKSFHGCCGIFHSPFQFKKDEKINVTIGKLFDLEGEVVWIESFDKTFMKVGIYLD